MDEAKKIRWAIVVTPAPSRELVGSMTVVGPYDDADEVHDEAMRLIAAGHDARACPWYEPHDPPAFLRTER